VPPFEEVMVLWVEAVPEGVVDWEMVSDEPLELVPVVVAYEPPPAVNECLSVMVPV
jgi:hypothetical protein